MGERNHLKNTGLAKSEFHHSYSGCSWLTWCELHHLGSYTSRQMISEIHLQQSNSALSKAHPVSTHGVVVTVRRWDWGSYQQLLKVSAEAHPFEIHHSFERGVVGVFWFHQFGNMLISTYITKDFPGAPVAKTLCFQCRGPEIWSLVRELDPTCHKEGLAQLNKIFKKNFFKNIHN